MGAEPDTFGLQEILQAFPAVFSAIAGLFVAADGGLGAGVEIVVDVDGAGLDTGGEPSASCVAMPLR